MVAVCDDVVLRHDLLSEILDRCIENNLQARKLGSRRIPARLLPFPRLHRLTGFGIVPGVTVKLHQTYPAFCIKFEETELAIERDVAEDIFVSRIGARE